MFIVRVETPQKSIQKYDKMNYSHYIHLKHPIRRNRGNTSKTKESSQAFTLVMSDLALHVGGEEVVFVPQELDRGDG